MWGGQCRRRGGRSGGDGGQGGEIDYLVLELFLHAFDGGCLGEEQILQGEEVFFVDAFVDLLLDEVAERFGGVDFRSQGIVGPCLDADKVVRETFGAMADSPEVEVDVGEDVAEAEDCSYAVPVEAEVCWLGSEVSCAEGCEVVVEGFDATAVEAVGGGELEICSHNLMGFRV